MDLLGDLGQEDQLTSTRAENKVLQEKVKELTIRVHELKCENEALKAEVEIYRGDANFLRSTGGIGYSNVFGESKDALVDDGADHFVTSGNGVYPCDAAVTLSNIHGISNPLCCAIHPDDSLLASGGADSNIKLCRWGVALAPGDESSTKAVNDAITIPCGAPVICCSFAQVGQGKRLAVVAAGCMDGSVKLSYGAVDDLDQPLNNVDRVLKSDNDIKHKSTSRQSVGHQPNQFSQQLRADGTIQLTKMGFVDKEKSNVSLEVIKSMHFDGAVESMCFINGNTLCCYVRGTPYLSYFDLKDDYKMTKVSHNGRSAGTANFDEHVSFAVLSLLPSPCGKYIALATDAGRNFIMESGTDKIVRNLYGHKNDGFSNPKIAWSHSGQYLYGNSQDTHHIVVWDIASESIVKELDSGGFVRDLNSSSNSDTLVSVSFDKTAKVWLTEM